MGATASGRALYEAMERLDPDGLTWPELSERDHEFYSLAMERALKNLGYLPAGSQPDKDVVSRRSKGGKEAH